MMDSPKNPGPNARPADASGLGDSERSLDALLCGPIASRDEFERALPLFVGGDLGPAEAGRVDEWLDRHPEDAGALGAARASYSVLRQHARTAQLRTTPDLWSGIRDELARSGRIESGARTAAAASSAVPRSGSTIGGAGTLGSPARSAETASGPAPILGGPRWFQRKSLAAAAALMFTGTVGFLLSAEADPSGAERVAVDARSQESSGVPAMGPGERRADRSSAGGGIAGVGAEDLVGPFDGTRLATSGAELAKSDRRGAGAEEAPVVSPRIVPLAPAGPDARHLVDDAESLWLWQFDRWPTVDTRSSARLTAGQ